MIEKVILDARENNKNTLVVFDAFGVIALTSIGREFTEQGHLINLGGQGSVTKTFDVIHEDIQGDYITHPEAFRGRWSDEYIDGLIGLIPETATVDFEFVRTVVEMA